MEQFPIAALRRDKQGTGPSRASRREGMVPGVIYGQGEEAVAILVPAKELTSFLRHHGSVVNLKIDGVSGTEGLAALLKDLERDPISRAILSVDFLRVSLTEIVQLSVPLVLVGESPGVKLEAGVLEQTLHELHVECLPTSIPERIEIDVSDLHTGHSLHVRDLVAPEGVTFLTSGDEAVATIAKGVKAEDLQPQLDEGDAVAVDEEAEGKSEG